MHRSHARRAALSSSLALLLGAGMPIEQVAAAQPPAGPPSSLHPVDPNDQWGFEMTPGPPSPGSIRKPTRDDDQGFELIPGTAGADSVETAARPAATNLPGLSPIAAAPAEQAVSSVAGQPAPDVTPESQGFELLPATADAGSIETAVTTTPAVRTGPSSFATTQAGPALPTATAPSLPDVSPEAQGFELLPGTAAADSVETAVTSTPAIRTGPSSFAKTQAEPALAPGPSLPDVSPEAQGFELLPGTAGADSVETAVTTGPASRSESSSIATSWPEFAVVPVFSQPLPDVSPQAQGFQLLPRTAAGASVETAVTTTPAVRTGPSSISTAQADPALAPLAGPSLPDVSPEAQGFMLLPGTAGADSVETAAKTKPEDETDPSSDAAPAGQTAPAASGQSTSDVSAESQGFELLPPSSSTPAAATTDGFQLTPAAPAAPSAQATNAAGGDGFELTPASPASQPALAQGAPSPSSIELAPSQAAPAAVAEAPAPPPSPLAAQPAPSSEEAAPPAEQAQAATAAAEPAQAAATPETTSAEAPGAQSAPAETATEASAAPAAPASEAVPPPPPPPPAPVAETPPAPAPAQAPSAGEAAAAAAAAEAEARLPVIGRIVIQGNERIEASTILSYLPLQPGDHVDAARIDLAVKTLFRTDLFADVSMEMQGSDLVVKVSENPIVNQVVFEGNHALKEDKLRDEVQIRPRGIFTKSKVEQDAQRIIELYRRSGRISATVTPKIVQLPQKRVDLIFEINEGPKSGILHINFIGNKSFSDNALRDVIVTRESHWYKFFQSNDNYDPDRIEYDREQVRKFYRNHGYYDFRIISAVAELDPSRNGFVVTFTIDEGPKYHFGKLKVETELKRLNGELLQALLPIRQGQLYEDERIEKATDALTYAAGANGFAFVDVRPRYVAHPQTKTVDVTFDIKEGPRVYIERIDIVGNTRTLDRVIRREMRVSEGDAYNRVLVDRSKNQIKALGFFKDIDIEQLPGSAPDKTILRVKVTEQPTGQLTFSLGYSSVEKLVGDVGISESNFRGRGQKVNFEVSLGYLRKQVSLSFTEPRFMGRNMAAGFDVYTYRYNYSTSASFTTSSTGLNLRTGFAINQYASISPHYAIHTDRVSIPSYVIDPTTGQCASGYSQSLCDEVGTTLTSAVGYSIRWDRRNDPITPTRGFYFDFGQDFAGVGGNVKYIRTTADTAWYYGITPKWVFSLQGKAGYITGWGGDVVRINDRFFVGGYDFRGFQIAGIGPRDVSIVDSTGTTVGDALGGKAYAVGTLELTVPTPIPEQYGIRTSLFTDFGTLGLLDDKVKRNPDGTLDTNIRDNMAFRASAGISVKWKSPMGPLEFDFSKVLKKAPYDRTETFRILHRNAVLLTEQTRPPALRGFKPMTNVRFRPWIASGAACALMALAGAALAQTTGPVAARPPTASPPVPAALPSGPAIPGVCVYNNNLAIGASAVGKYIDTRLKQLQSQATAEVTAEKNSLDADAKTLESQRATLSQDVLQQRALSLQQRAQALQRKAEQRSRELQLTEQKALQRVATEINPLLRQVYSAHQCSLLIDGSSVYGSNPNMDVTEDVVKLLNGKLTQFPFDRERLDEQQGAAASTAGGGRR